MTTQNSTQKLELARTLSRRCIEHAFTECESTFTVRVATAVDKAAPYGHEPTVKPTYSEHTFPACADCRRATREARFEALGLKMPKPKCAEGLFPVASAYRPHVEGEASYGYAIGPDRFVSDEAKLAIWEHNCFVSMNA